LLKVRIGRNHHSSLSGSPSFPEAATPSLQTHIKEPAMKDYLIERHIPGVEQLTPAQLKQASATSNAALAELGDGIEWVESFVAKDRTFCHYRAENEDIIREHARISGFPANAITEIAGSISPKTATS
jgi:hypothetical protein